MELFRHESYPLSDSCINCHQVTGRYRCKDCFGQHVWCDTCCISAHKHVPFHRIQLWNGKYFETSDILERRLILNLLHATNDCPLHPSNLGYSASQEGVRYELNDGETLNNHPPPNTPLQSELIVVTSAGIFTRSVTWCQCTKSSNTYVELLLRAKLFPASFKAPRTVFTFEVLDNFRIDALECRTAAMNFMSKIQRITNEAFPARVPVHFQIYSISCQPNNPSQDRYREMLRVSREWRDLHNRMRAGTVHDRTDVPIDGGLAMFCPACPQVDINIPKAAEWKSEDRYVIFENYTICYWNYTDYSIDLNWLLMGI